MAHARKVIGEHLLLIRMWARSREITKGASNDRKTSWLEVAKDRNA